MHRSNTQSERQLDLDRQIREGKYPTVQQIAKRWEVSKRTIKRDIEFMRDRMGAPIVFDPQRRGYCYSETTWGIPSIIVSEGELSALKAAPDALKECGASQEAEILRAFIARGLSFNHS